VKSYVLVGASIRALGMYAKPLVNDFSDCAKVVGVFDINPLRADIPDPLGHQADSFAGAISILIGISANKSIAEGRNVRVNDLMNLSKYRSNS
jgi:hypothetical protein